MSYTFKYLPEPGITYDIIRLLYVKLNATSIWKETLTRIDHQDQHIKYIYQQTECLPDPDNDLSIFVYIPTNRKKTFISSIADRLVENDIASYSVSDLFMYLNETDIVKHDLFSYYLGEQEYDMMGFESQLRSIKTIPDKIKLLLFGFSYNASTFIQKLIETIKNYHFQMNLSPLLDLPSTETLDQFTNLLLGGVVDHVTADEITVYYSLCKCTPVFLLSNYNSKNPMFISTLETIHEKVSNESSFTAHELLLLLQALDDKSRLDIIRLLKIEDELSTYDISQRLNLSLTATKYHLAILKKANMISFKRSNRNTHYTYNPFGYKNLLNALSNFEKGGILS